ncbi:hypothetical protein QQS21_002007 [Conoideocrella luteorostrata]|uniref:AB hydrolase-1 domain-containing protein n=1 Tax=Conoideocrella luteorostrata TaxID=1105319 RepID=A0AAJ0FX11_9HYPO|nr:hypothetical protein QQS21_002007 [Conoideocrella luteorostrata]
MERHPESKFRPFTLLMRNGGFLSGIVYLPNHPPADNADRPLVVLLHGGGCGAHHYDVDRDHTSSLAAEAVSLVVVSINRPCYPGSSSLLPVPKNSSFHRETGRWEHEFIFPLLWQTYGEPNGCVGLVVMAHSLATPGILVSASLHSQEAEPEYPLSGLILSGWGVMPNIESQRKRMSWSREQLVANRHILMLSEEHLDAADPRLRSLLPQHTAPAPPEEAAECVDGPWASYWTSFASRINIPIMFGIGEHDWLWQGTRDHVSKFEAFFPNCPRFDGSVVLGAPHAIEWSYFSRGWYARCFGFALEVAALSRRRVRAPT